MAVQCTSGLVKGLWNWGVATWVRRGVMSILYFKAKHVGFYWTSILNIESKNIELLWWQIRNKVNKVLGQLLPLCLLAWRLLAKWTQPLDRRHCRLFISILCHWLLETGDRSRQGWVLTWLLTSWQVTQPSLDLLGDWGPVLDWGLRSEDWGLRTEDWEDGCLWRMWTWLRHTKVRLAIALSALSVFGTF